MGEWKVQVARILGEPTTSILENYYGSESADLLEVNDERLLTFYDYLRDELKFPFMARYKQAKNAYELVCTRLDQETNVNEADGIKLACKHGETKWIIPLSEMVVDEKDVNFSTIMLYQKWFLGSKGI
ncbi:hypothetical protein GCM10011409_25610 [Lentibacillus populi]|uniref:Uncharacterized protein n=1 Tax=Lentibacillus populi TaxID=1827502 RepID=A0A9W5X6E9_9BACI|nr:MULTISPECIES: calcium-binding protein [Bacillaceae]MBT2216373.1 hypothetical protein [Virgibacillus dakarensis]GGB46970.1 hypothetical protein GCM10011409_25610 [Lentibacillus populi]